MGKNKLIFILCFNYILNFFVFRTWITLPSSVQLPNTDSNSNLNSNQSTNIAVAVSVALIIVVTITISVFLFISWKKKIFFFKQKQNQIDYPQESQFTPYQPISPTSSGALQESKSNSLAKINLSEIIGDWLISSTQLEIQEEVGSGAFGIVYKGFENWEKK